MLTVVLRYLIIVCLVAALLPWLGLGPEPFGLGGTWPRLDLLAGGSLYDYLAGPLALLAGLPGSDGLWHHDQQGQPQHIRTELVMLFYAVLCVGLLLARLALGRQLRARAAAVDAEQAADARQEQAREAVPSSPAALAVRTPQKPAGLKRGIGTAKRIKMNLEAVSFDNACPSLRCDCYLESPSPTRQASTLVVKFSGTYRHGSAGDPDAGYMRGMLRAACEFWKPSHLIIELADFSYVWGEALETVFDLAKDEVAACAVVLGELCRPAITSLLHANETEDDDEPEDLRPDEGFFDTLDGAFIWVHKR